ncbi:hypothetical protein K2173_009479 [Erythroxylum novogranatense]|uniref:G-box binding protein multifunctional mosaic region domain-containing protein n=1 Tax=Erythroxylum novogranatense TaxID=1862640 RepID=A0AAV8U885_9ROSI|nr:hypothetical protein K2173_009479 [Erythroxylum novogranatense]
MGGSDTDKTTKEKEPKTSTQPASTTQEQSSTPSTGHVNNPDWSGFQAYSPMPPHGFLASGPQAPPYMWGVQHIMPPYGTPPHPYVTMYPPGGIYTHPSLPPGSYPFSPFAMPSNGVTEASGNTPGSMEADGKPSDTKEKLPIKRSKGSLGSLNMITGKNNHLDKTTGAAANGIYSKSGETGSEGTSEGSDANSQSDSQMKSGGYQDSVEADASENGGSAQGAQNGGQGNAVVNQPVSILPISATGAPGAIPGPATNLNIGMDYWGAPNSSTGTAIHGKVSSTPIAGAIVTTGSRDSVQSQLWLQVTRNIRFKPILNVFMQPFTNFDQLFLACVVTRLFMRSQVKVPASIISYMLDVLLWTRITCNFQIINVKFVLEMIEWDLCFSNLRRVVVFWAVFACLILMNFVPWPSMICMTLSLLVRMKERSRDREGSSPIENLPVVPGCANRPNVMSWHSVLKP